MLKYLLSILSLFTFFYSTEILPCIDAKDPPLIGTYSALSAQYEKLLQETQEKLDKEQKSLISLGDPPERSSSRTESTMALQYYLSAKNSIESNISTLTKKITCYDALTNAFEKLDRYNTEISNVLSMLPASGISRETKIYEWKVFLNKRSSEVSNVLGSLRGVLQREYGQLVDKLKEDPTYPQDVLRYALRIQEEFANVRSESDRLAWHDEWTRFISSLRDREIADRFINELASWLQNAALLAQRRLLGA